MHNYVSGNLIVQAGLSLDNTWKNKLPQLTDLLDFFFSDKLFVSNRAKECNWIIFHTIKKKKKTLSSKMVAKYSSSVILHLPPHSFSLEKVPG